MIESEAEDDPIGNMAASAVAEIALFGSARSTAAVVEGRAAGGVANAGERGVARLAPFA